MTGQAAIVKKTAQDAASTNKTKNSLVKLVVTQDSGKWISPSAQEEYLINEDATFPTINFEIETDKPSPYVWSWKITWEAKQRTKETGSRGSTALRTFTENGKFESNDKKWTADLGGKVIGGKLTVEVKVGSDIFKRSVVIKAKNPEEQKVIELLGTIDDVKGFEKIIDKESSFKQFIAADGEPVLSFDGGYGLTQMTNPEPTYEQAWNWKENVKGGSSLYQEKQKSAKSYLGKDGRTYTDEQLKLETWSRWNGGSYHVWDDKTKVWKRNDDLLCDSNTGNIGWDTTDTDNKDKTEAELHRRDKDTYANPKKNKKSGNKWKYTGVCYADHLSKE
ncbi:MAG: hypothetical protein QM581_05480 [Pseudomonas sp.]